MTRALKLPLLIITVLLEVYPNFVLNDIHNTGLEKNIIPEGNATILNTSPNEFYTK